MGLGFGGNANWATGQIETLAGPQLVPFPSNLNANYLASVPATYAGNNLAEMLPAPVTGMTGIEGARRKIVNWTDDIVIGGDWTVTPGTGWLIPAGRVEDVTTRGAVWFCSAADAGTVSSSSQAIEAGVSSLSGQTEETTMGPTFWMEEHQ